MALKEKSSGVSTGIGISDRGKAHPAAVKIVGATSLVLGSGVAIAPRWILSAAHLFRGPQLRVSVVAWGGQHRAAVRTIHWHDTAYTFPGSGESVAEMSPWPEEVARLQGESDEIVLLELDQDLGLGQEDYAKPDAASYTPGTKLRIVGFGVDGNGNYDPGSIPTIMRMISGVPDRPGFGLCVSDPHVRPGGDMPRSDDSGAPVFLAGSQRVVGIHSSRRVPAVSDVQAGDEVACFIAMTRTVLDWIETLVGVQSSAMSGRSTASIAKPQRFVLRRKHVCLTLADGSRSLDGTWHLNGTSARPSVLLLCDRIEIGADGSGATTFSLYRCGAAQAVYQGQAVLGGDSKVSNAWLHVRPRPGYAALEYFVFRRTDGWLPVRQPDGSARTELARRIHIEAFVENSSHEKPPGELETDMEANDDLDIVACSGCLKTQKVEVDDQDDEGDAYEG